MLTYRIFIIGTSNVGKSTIANTLIGNIISEIGPSTDTTLSIIKVVLKNKTYQLFIYDFPGIGGIEGFLIEDLIGNIQKIRRSRSSKDSKVMSMADTVIGIDMLNKINSSDNKRGKSLILFVFDIVNGFKKEDFLLLEGVKKAFPRTSVLIVPNKIDWLDNNDIDISLMHYKFENNKNVICCSLNSECYERLITKIANTLLNIL